MYTKVSAADDLNDATDTAETKDAAPASDEKENAVAATTAEGGSNAVLASSFGRALELSSLLRRYAGQNSN